MTSDTLWHTVATSIEAKIKDQTFAPGDKLPTEAEFSREFGVNRHTIRRALQFLHEKDLIEAVQGRGTFVRRPALRFEIGRRTRFSDALKKQSVRGGAETRTLALITPQREVADALGIQPRNKVVFLERVGFAEDVPISLSRHYFSHERFPFFKDFYQRKGSVTETLVACGVPDFIRQRTVVDARVPTAEECSILNVPKHVPLLHTKSWNVDSFQRPLEYGESLFASDRVELEINAALEPAIDVVETPDEQSVKGVV